MALCFVFTPAKPKLYTLNTSAWLVLALCDGRSGRALVDAYAGEMSQHLSRDESLGEVRNAVRDLELKGIVARVQGGGAGRTRKQPMRPERGCDEERE
jgi:hypothetical protein